MRKILVTGGAGFIGSHTVVELHNAGYEPIIVDNLSNSSADVLAGLKTITGKTFQFYQVDCNDETAMTKVFEDEGDLAGAVHFAAYKAVGESVKVPLQYYANNIGSLTVLLRLMQQHKVPNLVFSSSCTVYGEPDELPVTEASPIKEATSPYGYTKQAGEHIIKDTVAAEAGLRAVLLRYFNPIGAHPSGEIGELPLGVPNNLVPFITQTAAGLRGELTVHGSDYPTPDGTCIRDYIHVVDLARAHVAALDWLFGNPGTNFEFFNVGTGRGNSVLEVVHTFEEVTGKKLNYKLGPRRDGDVVQVYSDVKKIRAVLGWEAQLTLADALRDAWNWQMSLNHTI